MDLNQIKHILSYNPIIVKRKLKIYNFLNNTEWSLKDLNIHIQKDIVFYYCKRIYKHDTIYDFILEEYCKNYIEAVKWFKDTLDNSIQKTDKNIPNKVFLYDKEGKYLLEQNLEEGIFYISCDNIWYVLDKNYNYSYHEICELSNPILEAFFNCEPKSFMTMYLYSRDNLSIKNF